MEKFLSFLTVSLTRSHNHLGSENGWTRLRNEENKLIIGGGIVGGIEYLDRMEYGTNLDNPYNNYVNPFYLWDIMNDEGRQFFLEYYKADIEKILSDIESNIEFHKKKAVEEADKLELLRKHLEDIKP